MSKSKESKETLATFGAFNVLKGAIIPLEHIEDIESGDKYTMKDDLEEDEAEKAKLAEGDKILEETQKKTKEIQDKKNKPESEEVTDNSNELEENQENKEVEILKTFVDDLYEKGALDVDSKDENFDGTEKGISKLVDKTVQNRIDKWVESKNPTFIDFMEFTDNGGDPKEFLEVFYGKQSWENFKVDSEENQKLAIKESLIRISGDTAEEADEKITEWSENGTLEKHSKSALTKLQKFEINEKKRVVEENKKSSDNRKKAEKESFEGFKKDLFSREDIKGFKLTPKIKEKLWDYMTVANSRSGKTGYQEALENDTEASLLFALQSMNGFNIEKLEKQVASKAANKIADLLKNRVKSSKESISTGSPEELGGINPFAGFKRV